MTGIKAICSDCAKLINVVGRGVLQRHQIKGGSECPDSGSPAKLAVKTPSMRVVGGRLPGLGSGEPLGSPVVDRAPPPP